MADDDTPPQKRWMSWSTLDTMLSCPKKFQLRKIVKVQQRPMWAGLGGSAVHAAVEAIERSRYAAGFTVAQEETADE